jgi:quinolinate synthase
MRLSTRSRYSVRALIDIICNGGEKEPVSLRRIAFRQGVSEKYLEQLFIILRKAGIVKASRGVKGGYRLTRPSEEIYLGEILRFTERDIEPVTCSECERDDVCSCKYCWDYFGEVIENYVDSVTLKDICLGRIGMGKSTYSTQYERSDELVREIERMKKRKNAVLLVHNYQRAEIQQIADYIGDSLDLSRRAMRLKEKVIVFCGVKFMAESAKVLSPKKTVLLPRLDAGCPMADMITVDELKEMKKEYPKAKVVCYVNTSADVKAESDICCTSANAVEVVESLKVKQVIFIPDKNLADYVDRQTKKKIIPWYGYCYVHEYIKLDDIKNQKRLHPKAKVMVHPETSPEVVKYSDYVLGTNGMVNLAKKSRYKEFIVGTEEGLVTRLQRENPQKKFYLPSKKPICSNMKKTHLKDVYLALKDMRYKIEIDEKVLKKAQKALRKMIRNK